MDVSPKKKLIAEFGNEKKLTEALKMLQVGENVAFLDINVRKIIREERAYLLLSFFIAHC